MSRMRTSEVRNISVVDSNQASGSLQLDATPHPNASLLQASQPLCPTHICDPHISVPNAFVRHAFIPHISVPRDFLTFATTQSLLHSSLLVVAAQVAASKLLPRGCCHAAAILGLLPQGRRHKVAATPSSGIGVAK